MDPISIGLGVAGLATSAGNSLLQAQSNKKNREWSEHMYERQKADQLAAWGMQNEYNSPTAQMKRLQEAGLNPHLVYGSGAANQAAPIKVGDAPAYKNQPVQMDLSPAQSVLGQYYDTKMKTAQTNLIETQNTVAIQEAALKQAQTANTMMQTARGKFDLEMLNSLKANSLQMAEQNLRKLTTETDVLVRRDFREAIMQSSNLSEAVKRMAKMDAETSNLGMDKKLKAQALVSGQLDQQLKQWEIELSKLNLTKNDPLWIRGIKELYDYFMQEPKTAREIERSKWSTKKKVMEFFGLPHYDVD